MREHARPVPSANQEGRELLHALLEVLPVQAGAADDAGVHRSVHLLVREGVERGHGHVEQWQGAFEGGLGGEAHVELEEVNLSQAHRHHLVDWSGSKRAHLICLTVL